MRATVCRAALLALLLAAATARADNRSVVTLGLNVHGTYAQTATEADTGRAFGVGARLKLGSHLGLDVAYDLAAKAERTPAPAPAQLVTNADLRTALILTPIPNRWFAPFLALGAGWNTGPWSLLLCAGGGFEVELTPHLVFVADARWLFPDPRDVAGQVQVRLRSIRGHEVALPSWADYYNARSFLITAGLTWML